MSTQNTRRPPFVEATTISSDALAVFLDAPHENVVRTLLAYADTSESGIDPSSTHIHLPFDFAVELAGSSFFRTQVRA